MIPKRLKCMSHDHVNRKCTGGRVTRRNAPQVSERRLIRGGIDLEEIGAKHRLSAEKGAAPGKSRPEARYD